MMASEKPQSGRFLIFLIVSILVHLGLFVFLFLGPRYLFLTELNRRLDHTIENKTEDLITQIELINDEELKKQVIEQSDKSVNEAEPKEADYLSATNQKVEKQTKARNNGKFNNSSSPGVNQISVGQKSKQKSEQPSEKPVVKNLGLNGLPLSSETHKENSEDRKSFVSLGEGLSQTDDYLENVDEGDQTLLNTKEFVYYSYFMRVKDQLRSHWNPLIRKNVQVLYAKDRNIASLHVKATSVRITLNKSGYLEKIELLKTSGYEELDVAAIQAFRSAAPFLNPPTGLIEKDKRIRIVWDFILES
jgi:TonB family protein